MGSGGLLTNPEEYAEKAIAELQRQLETTKSKTKMVKIRAKIFQWTKMLELMRDTCCD